LVFYRTQLFTPNDIEHVNQIQAGYGVQPLSAFLGKPAPAPAPAIDFYPPLNADDERTSLQFFAELNFLLQFCPAVPAEVVLRARFARLGIGAGLDFASDALSPELRQAVQDGMADAWHAYEELDKKLATGELSSGDLFGTREYLHNNDLYRMAGAVDGIYGNSKDEAIYPAYFLDATGQPLDGASHHYTLRFAQGQLPPVNAFWSLTMYKLPERLLVENPINRYLINSPMLPNLQTDADGGITLSVQHESPGADLEANWLPAPAGPFMMVLRLYWPKPEALDGTWAAPALQRID
jgi:hypothetical protein